MRKNMLFFYRTKVLFTSEDFPISWVNYFQVTKGGAKMADYHVTLFISPWNKAECDEAKKYLANKGINYVEKNIQDPGAQGELSEKTGQVVCPTIDVDGHIVVGYLPDKWDHFLSEEPLELT